MKTLLLTSVLALTVSTSASAVTYQDCKTISDLSGVMVQARAKGISQVQVNKVCKEKASNAEFEGVCKLVAKGVYELDFTIFDDIYHTYAWVTKTYLEECLIQSASKS